MHRGISHFFCLFYKIFGFGVGLFATLGVIGTESILMTMKDNNIDFVARHYRRGAFSAVSAWCRLGIVSPARWYKRAAAAVAVTAVLGATAAFLYRQYDTSSEIHAVPEVQVESRYTVLVIDFDNAPLTEVVDRIESVYGVKVTGMPSCPDTYMLTLHYEGNADDLITAINDILDTHMGIE